MTSGTNVCEPKMCGFVNISPTLNKKYRCDDLRDKDPKIVTVNFFKMMTKLPSLEVRSPLKNVFIN